MGIILGFVCVICFGLLAVKAVTRLLHLQRADRLFMKLHKPVSTLLLLLCILHVAFVFPVLRTRSMYVNISGIAVALCILLLIILCHSIKDGKKRLFWHRTLAIVMAVGIIGHIVSYTQDFQSYQQRIADIDVNEVDISKIKDGVYEGECDVDYIYARVQVTVSDGKITAVDLLEHRNERGAAAESVIGAVTEKQKIDVDTVSGATNSSKVIKKAIETAMINAMSRDK